MEITLKGITCRYNKLVSKVFFQPVSLFNIPTLYCLFDIDHTAK